MESEADLFFESLTGGALGDADHMDRSWLFEQIFDRLAEPDVRIVLVTAEPGAGKTVVAAGLTRRDPLVLPYFIRRDSRGAAASGDARAFLLRLGHQLVTLQPQLFLTEACQAFVKQRVGIVNEGGRVIGAQIGDYVVSPFQRAAISVQQNVDRVRGDLIGMTIERFVDDERLLDPENLQHLALYGPAAALDERDPHARILVVVDGLDELRHRAVPGVPGPQTLLHWLATCPPLPPNVRFICLSRPDDSLLRQLRAMQSNGLAEITLDASLARISADVATLSRRIVSHPGVAGALRTAGIAEAEFADRAAARADGNLLYLAMLGRAIDQMSPTAPHSRDVLDRLLRLEDVPAGLRKLYEFFFDLVRSEVQDKTVNVAADDEQPIWAPAWPALYHPLLAVLAIAFEPLTARQLTVYANLSCGAEWVAAALDDLGQFLEEDGTDYRLYHTSLADFLTSADFGPSDAAVAVAPGSWHRRVGRQIRSLRRPTWQSVADQYAFRHLITHLDAAEQRDDARDVLLDLDWVLAKVDACGIDEAIRDYLRFPEDPVIAELARALRLSVGVVRNHPDQLWGQLLGRLDSRAMSRFDVGQVRNGERRRLLPLRPSLATSNGPLLVTLDHGTAVYEVAVTGDGARAASMDTDGGLRVWDVHRALEVFRAPGTGGGRAAVNPLLDLSISQDGSTLAARTYRGVEIWDVDKGLQIAVLDGDAPIALTDRGDRVRYRRGTQMLEHAVGAAPDRAGTWPAPPEGTHPRAMAADGTVLALSDGGPVAYSGPQSTTPKRLTGHGDMVSAFSLSRNGRFAATGTAYYEGAVRVWDLVDGELLRTFRPSHAVNWDSPEAATLAVTPDGSVVFAVLFLPSGSAIQLWSLEVRTGVARMVWASAGVEVTSSAITDDGRTVITGMANGSVRVWELEPAGAAPVSSAADVIAHQMSSAPRISAVALDSAAGVALTGSFSADHVTLWDLESGDSRAQSDVAYGSVESIYWLRGGRAAVECPGSLHLLDVDTAETIGSWKMKVNSRLAGRWPEGLVIVTREMTELVVERIGAPEPDPRSGELGRRRSREQRARLTLSTRHHHLRAARGSRGVSFDQDSLSGWDLVSGRQLWTTEVAWPDSVSEVVVADDGEVFVASHGVPGRADQRYSVTVRDLKSGAELWRAPSDGARTSAVALSATGDHLAAGQTNGVVVLFDVRERTCLSRWTADYEITAITVSPDGTQVVAGDSSGVAHLLRLT